MSDDLEHTQKKWHLSERIMAGVIIGLILSSISNIGSWVYLTKTLNTTPPLPERVSRLEWQVEEMGRVLVRFEATLTKLDVTLDRVASEQARRTPTINYMEQRIKNNGK